ncbi:sodium channel subunit beta-2 isoform X2 [Lates calcarifer]|nr:sodium channel subunit beta-2 isoform X2 [Lates calcarifer]
MLCELKVKPGEDVTLHCQGPRDAAISELKWSRPDLESERYVLYFRENQLHVKDQHLSFRGRVELRDREMKYGDASVILKNVTIKDTGRYECYVRKTGSRPELISTISLTVESGIGRVVVLAVAVVVVAVIVAAAVRCFRRR